MKILSENRNTILKVAAKYGATNVRVFGSAARDDMNSASDIDILINLEDGRSLLDIIAIKQDLEDLIGRKVDVLTERAISPYIRDQVLDEAVLL